MNKLVLTPKFKRAFRKITRRNAKLRVTIEQTLFQMEQDLFVSQLGTHKLSGNLYGLWACACGYDCRIVFSIEKDPSDNSEVVVLLDVGTHDEV